HQARAATPNLPQFAHAETAIRVIWIEHSNLVARTGTSARRNYGRFTVVRSCVLMRGVLGHPVNVQRRDPLATESLCHARRYGGSSQAENSVNSQPATLLFLLVCQNIHGVGRDADDKGGTRVDNPLQPSGRSRSIVDDETAAADQ